MRYPNREELHLPHPRLHERQFVLVPLAEIDPHFMHPVFQKTVQELLINLKEDQGVETSLRDTPKNDSNFLRKLCEKRLTNDKILDIDKLLIRQRTNLIYIQK